MKNYNKGKEGLDWDEIRKDYEAKASPKELETVDDTPQKRATPRRRSTAKKVVPKTGKAERNPDDPPPQRRLDWDKIVHLYVEDKLEPNEIAARMDCKPNSIRNILRRLGVLRSAPPRKGIGGSGKQEYCGIRGKGPHKMEGRNIVMNGTKRNCRACKSERQRGWARKKYNEAKQVAR